MILKLQIVYEFCINTELSLLLGHLSTFVELELEFEESIVNIRVLDNGELQLESLRGQLILV